MILENLKLKYRAWKYKNREDPAEISYLLQCIRPGDTVFDIGAHKGGYTYWMEKAVGSEGKVIAFEPQLSGARLLRNLFRSRNVHVVGLGISNSKGKQELFIKPQANRVSYEASLEKNYQDGRIEVIDTTTIDHYCHDNEIKPAFLKIDVEGHEKEVLEGGKTTITNYHPFLLVEIEERHAGRQKMESIFNFMRNLDYDCYFFYDGVKTPLEKFDHAQHQSIENLVKNKKLYSNNFVFEPKT